MSKRTKQFCVAVISWESRAKWIDAASAQEALEIAEDLHNQVGEEAFEHRASGTDGFAVVDERAVR